MQPHNRRFLGDSGDNMSDDDEEELLLPPSNNTRRTKNNLGSRPLWAPDPIHSETINAETSPDSLAEVKYEGFSEFNNSRSSQHHQS